MEIRRLPQNLINQIAAGEVVERPSSALKELIENSLDANATQIDIIIENGGKNLISVSDNGIGIQKDHIPLAIERPQIKDLVWSGGAIQIEKGPKMNENFLNNVVELLSNPERLEDMGRNSLIASGYAQQRADEASINLIELLKRYRNTNVA